MSVECHGMIGVKPSVRKAAVHVTVSVETMQIVDSLPLLREAD